jgi:hypothetical protein
MVTQHSTTQNHKNGDAVAHRDAQGRTLQSYITRKNYKTFDMLFKHVICENCDPNFTGFVLGYIEASKKATAFGPFLKDFRHQILVGNILTRRIDFTSFCTSPITKFPQVFIFFIAAKYFQEKSHKLLTTVFHFFDDFRRDFSRF